MGPFQCAVLSALFSVSLCLSLSVMKVQVRQKESSSFLASQRERHAKTLSSFVVAEAKRVWNFKENFIVLIR